MASLAQLKILESLAARTERTQKAQQSLKKFDSAGRVRGVADGRYEIRTALGNTVFVPARNVITNGNPGAETVLVTRPKLGSAFVDGKVRG